MICLFKMADELRSLFAKWDKVRLYTIAFPRIDDSVYVVLYIASDILISIYLIKRVGFKICPRMYSS